MNGETLNISEASRDLLHAAILPERNKISHHVCLRSPAVSLSFIFNSKIKMYIISSIYFIVQQFFLDPGFFIFCRIVFTIDNNILRIGRKHDKSI